MLRRALLVFADAIQVDLARRAFPNAARPLLGLTLFGADGPSGVDVHLFTSGSPQADPAHSVHRQAGGNFASRFENAVETIARLGYDEVVAIGRDCPALDKRDIERAFAELGSCRLVLGPDHRGGCYLIAFRCSDRALLHGIRWKQNTDCGELRQRAGAARVFLLPVKHDLDSWNDLSLFARANHRLAVVAAFLLSNDAVGGRTRNFFVTAAARHLRVRQQMPPPALAA